MYRAGAVSYTHLAFLAMLREGAAVSEKYFAQLSTATPSTDEDATLVSRMLASQGFKA